MYERVYVRMYVCMRVCIYVCMYVFRCILLVSLHLACIEIQDTTIVNLLKLFIIITFHDVFVWDSIEIDIARQNTTRNPIKSFIILELYDYLFRRNLLNDVLLYCLQHERQFSGRSCLLEKGNTKKYHVLLVQTRGKH